MLTRAQADFGLILPRISLLATIALAYSVLSPIINGLAMLSFLLFSISWRFREWTLLLFPLLLFLWTMLTGPTVLTWVFNQPDETETGGQYVRTPPHDIY